MNGVIFYEAAINVKDYQRPPEAATHYWRLFSYGVGLVTAYTVGSLIAGYGITSATIWAGRALVLMFLMGEGGAMGIKFPWGLKGPYATHSEYVWYYWPHKVWFLPGLWVRTVWALLLSVMAGIVVHAAVGILLALWLIQHLSLKGRFTEERPTRSR